MFIVMVVAVATINCTADPIVRAPRVSEKLKEKIDYYKKVAEGQKYPNHFVSVEGQWSNEYSSAQELPDYFVVKASNRDGGRILKMSPIGTVFGGMSVPPVFTDVLTGEVFFPSLQTQDVRNGPYDYTSTDGRLLENYFQYGSLVIHGDVYNIVIAYADTPRYPTVSMTWGAESDLMHAGTIIDTFDDVSVEDPATETEVWLHNSKGEVGLSDGLYLLVSSPKEVAQLRIETSTDLKSWREMTVQPYYIFGDVIVYQIPSANLGFFRAKEL